MNTDGTVLGKRREPAAPALATVVKRLDTYLAGLEPTPSKRSEIIDNVFDRIQTSDKSATMAGAIAALHVVLAEAQTDTGVTAVRASASKRTEMWIGTGAPQQGADPSTYLQRPLIKRMAMLPETRPDVAAGGVWRRRIRLNVGQ